WVSVRGGVREAPAGGAVPGARFRVWVGQPAGGRGAVAPPATTEAATNKLLHAAVFELAEPGWWELEVVVQGPRGPGRVRCAVEAAEPWPRWLVLWPWVAWPVLMILLFGVHQFLVRRRSRPPQW